MQLSVNLLVLASATVVALSASTGQAVGPNVLPAKPWSVLANTALYFETNRGQVESGFPFVARGRECQVLLAPTEAVLVLGRPAEPARSLPPGRFALSRSAAVQIRSVHFRLEGANPQAPMVGLQELPGKANYFIGNDPARWQTGIHLYPKVEIDQIYPGVRLVYYADESARLEYDFVLQPDASPDRISLRLEGVDQVGLDAAGNLVLKVDGEEIRQHAPVIYQVVQGVRRPIDGGYRLKGGAQAGFWVGAYDHRLPLVIDPTLSFAACVGGKLDDRGWGIAAAPDGSVWIAGETLSTDLRTTNGLGTDAFFTPKYQGGHSVFGDGFVANFGHGTNLNYLTYLGGRGQDAAFAIAVDPNTGAAFVTGYTDSPNFPIYPLTGQHPAFQTRLAGTNLNARRVNPIDAFVTKLDTNGILVYSTYLGGNNRDAGLGVAVDNLGRAYITGLTESPLFPVTNALHGQYVYASFSYNTNNTRVTDYYRTNYYGVNYGGAGDAFVARLSADGSALEYSTFLGGTNQDYGQAIAVDTSYNAYVVGITSSTNFPTTNALSYYLNNQTNHSYTSDGFISKLSPNGDTLLYSTYIGGEAGDAAVAVALDMNNNAYVTGYTYSTNFPVTSNYFTAWPSPTNSNSDIFVMRFSPNGSVTNSDGGYSVVLGGPSDDTATGIAVDGNTNVYVVGLTSSRTNFVGLDSPTNFVGLYPTNLAPGFSTTNVSVNRFGTKDAFIIELDSTGTNLLFAADLGGSGNDQINGIALDPTTTGVAYFVGTTTSTNFPGVSTNPPTNFHGGRNRSDAIIGKIQFP